MLYAVLILNLNMFCLYIQLAIILSSTSFRVVVIFPVGHFITTSSLYEILENILLHL